MECAIHGTWKLPGGRVDLEQTRKANRARRSDGTEAEGTHFAFVLTSIGSQSRVRKIDVM